MKNFIKIAIGLMCFLPFLGAAQVRIKTNSHVYIDESGKFLRKYPQKVDLMISDLDPKIIRERQEDLETRDTTNKMVFKFAEAVKLNIDLVEKIEWIKEDQFAYGKFTMHLNKALSLSINFDNFYLPPGSEMYIYNRKGETVVGPINEKENNKRNSWGSWVFKGEYLVCEIKTPVSSFDDLKLNLQNIAYGFRDIKMMVADFGESAACHINAICPLGNGWEAERNSVALGISGDGTSAFSGFLVMNTCSTSRPLFLTANHVYTNVTPSQNVTNWRFTFQEYLP